MMGVILVWAWLSQHLGLVRERTGRGMLSCSLGWVWKGWAHSLPESGSVPTADLSDNTLPNHQGVWFCARQP